MAKSLEHMKNTQYKSLGRLSALNPFDVAGVQDLRPGLPALNAARRELLNRETEGYGCVDWYQYPCRHIQSAHE